ncbi:hypothetical protein C2U69_23420 [Cupriavidus pinatubonensis]|nr:hypothetical protein C2U69_23420 [Cupriavidus pinatubonensis]
MPTFTDKKAFVFPCNASGHVFMKALSERARSRYLFARATVGIGGFYARSKSLRGAVRIGANLMSSRHLMRRLHRPPATTVVFRGSITGPRVPPSALRPQPSRMCTHDSGLRIWLSLQRITLLLSQQFAGFDRRTETNLGTRSQQISQLRRRAGSLAGRRLPLVIG